MITAKRVLVCCLCLLAPLGHARAQAPAPAAPWALFTARYDTRTSDFIYALYGYGSSFAMVGALHNPRTDWSELLGAVGRMFTDARGNSHAIAAGVAQTADLWYGQVYYVPSVRAGLVNVRATAELDYPISRGGVTQFALSPISATVRVMGPVELGPAMDLAAARGDRTGIAIGPELRLPVPHATLGIDGERMTNGSGSRLRLFFTTQF
jgi:hypothetical protein